MACITVANPPRVTLNGYLTFTCFSLFAIECRWQLRLGVPMIDASHLQFTGLYLPGFTIIPYFGITARGGHTPSARLNLAV